MRVRAHLPGLVFLLACGVLAEGSVLGLDLDARSAHVPPSSLPPVTQVQVQPGQLPPQMQLAVTNELEASETLPGKMWDAETVSRVASRIASLPDLAANELLWRFASAPPDVDVFPVFSNALAAVSPRIRASAYAILLERFDRKSVRLVDGAIVEERDPDVIVYVINGLADLPAGSARERLGGILAGAVAGGRVHAEATAALQRLK